MPWCPKCRNEYRDGITICAECKIELVERLEDIPKQAFIFGEKDKMERLQGFLAYEKIETELQFDETENTYQLCAAAEDMKAAVKATQVFLQQELSQETEEEEAHTQTEKNNSETIAATEDAETARTETTISENKPAKGNTTAENDERKSYHAYQDSATKAEDNRSSAYTLLVVGGIGFVLDVLVFLGVLPVYQNAGMTKYLVCGVMGAMFILFIVFGFVSMRTSRILLVKAKTENSLLSEMTKWCETNLSKEKIDEGLFEGEELLEEQKYFKRAEKMKALISDKFLNLDEAFLEHFIDEYYQRIFESE